MILKSHYQKMKTLFEPVFDRHKQGKEKTNLTIYRKHEQFSLLSPARHLKNKNLKNKGGWGKLRIFYTLYK